MRTRQVTPPLRAAAQSEAGHAFASLVFSKDWPDDLFDNVHINADQPFKSHVSYPATDVTAQVQKALSNGYVLHDDPDSVADLTLRINARLVVTSADFAARKHFDSNVLLIDWFQYDDDRWSEMVATGEFHWTDQDQLVLLAFYTSGAPNTLSAHRGATSGWNYRKAINEAIANDSGLQSKLFSVQTDVVRQAKEMVMQHTNPISELIELIHDRALQGHFDTSRAEIEDFLAS